MSEEELAIEAKHMGSWEQHKFMVLVALTIVISLLLVTISLWLYNSSGAAQLDLSRPGYEAAREQASNANDVTGFSSSGVIDGSAVKEFRRLYDEQLTEVTAHNSFGGDVLSDEALRIDAPEQQSQE